MSRKFIGVVLAASLAVTGLTAVPAKAQIDTVGEFVGVAATLFILGKAVESHIDRRTDHAGDRTVRPVQVQHIPPGYNGHKLPKVVTKTPRVKLAPLPSRCRREVTGARTKYVMMKRCLDKRYQSARPLPNKCKLMVYANGKPRTAYSLRCLRKRGYEVNWRHH